MKKIYILSVAMLLVVACGKNNTFELRGTLEGGEGQRLYLEELSPEGAVFIDSITIDKDGSFAYTCQMPYPSLYNLHVSEHNYIVTQPNYGEVLTITGQYSDLARTYTIEGSDASLALWELQQHTNHSADLITMLIDTSEYYARLHAIGQVSEAIVEAKHAYTDSLYLEYYYAQQEYIMQYIELYTGEITTLIALYTTFNGQPIINPTKTEGLECYQQVADGLMQSQPDNPHTQRFVQMVARMTAQHD